MSLMHMIEHLSEYVLNFKHVRFVLKNNEFKKIKHEFR